MPNEIITKAQLEEAVKAYACILKQAGKLSIDLFGIVQIGAVLANACEPSDWKEWMQ